MISRHTTQPVKRASALKAYAVKVISLFSSVRVYNVATIAVAQLLAAVFILSGQDSLRAVLLDYQLWLIMLATSAAIAGGYIINNFYDREKDLINRPRKTLLENQVRRSTLWTVYFSLNTVSFLLGMVVSWRAGFFFAGYIFLMWFYSHKLKRVLFMGNVMAAVLAIMPFFVLFAYYGNWNMVIFVHGSFLMLILCMREIIKDLENLPGDLVHGYHTIPAELGERTAKIFYFTLSLLAIIPIAVLLILFDTGYMGYYFCFAGGALLVCVPLLFQSRRKREYLLIHFILKLIIILGVLSIFLLDPSVVTGRLGV